MAKRSCGFSALAAVVAASAAAQTSAPTGQPSALDLAFPTLPEREIRWELDPGGSAAPAGSDKLRVGDRIVIRIELLAGDPPAPEVRVGPPPGVQDFVDQGWSFGSAGAEGASTVELAAIPVRPGNQASIPALALYEGDMKTPFARTAPVPVGEILAPRDPNEPPAEILPPVSLEFPVWVLVVAALLGLGLLGGAGYGAYRLATRMKGKPLPSIPQPPKPEDELALESLRKIKAENFAAKGRFKEHYFGVSETMKAYVGSRFGFDASESTTREMIEAMEGKGIPDTLVDRIETLFDKLDLVKFTDHVPQPSEPDQVLEEARQFVMTTRKPKPAVLPQQEAGAR